MASEAPASSTTPSLSCLIRGMQQGNGSTLGPVPGPGSPGHGWWWGWMCPGGQMSAYICVSLSPLPRPGDYPLSIFCYLFNCLVSAPRISH